MKNSPSASISPLAIAAFVCGMGCEAMGVFGVTDLAVGLTTIRAELEDLDFLDRSEIAWLDTRESIWRYYYPESQGNQMESTEATSLAWIETVVARLKKAQGL